MPLQTVLDMINVGKKGTLKYPSSTFTSIFGQSQTGKTTFVLQILFELSHLSGKPALIYDTEGGIDDIVDAWTPTFKKRWPRGAIEVRLFHDIRDILFDHGYTIELVVAEKIMYNRRRKIAAQSPMLRLCKEKKYCAISYDSLTPPFQVYGTELPNLNARSDARKLWFLGMQAIQTEIKCPIFMIHHASKAPNDKNIIPNLTGGSSVHFASKYIYCFVKPGFKPYRYIYTYRHPRRPPFGRNWRVNYTENGFTDSNIKPPDIKLDDEQ